MEKQLKNNVNDLKDIQHPSSSPEKEEQARKLTKAATLEFNRAKADVKSQELKNVSFQQSLDIKKKLTWHLFWFVIIWCALILTGIALIGLGIFNLSNSVTITLISSTTINIVGLFYVVVKHFFPHNDGS